MKKILYILIFIILCSSVFSCQNNYGEQDNISIYDYIIPSGLNATCNITIYSNNSIIRFGNMTQNGLYYYFNTTYLNKGNYISTIYCIKNETEYFGECVFSVGADLEVINMEIAIILGILGFTAILLYIAFNIDDKHFYLRTLIILVTVILQSATGYFVLKLSDGTVLDGLGQIFYKAVLTFIVIFSAYIFIFITYIFLKDIGKLPKMFKKKYNND